MPLIDVTLKPDYAFPEFVGYLQDPELGRQATRDFVHEVFAPSLPGIFAENCAVFGMDSDTPADGVQVRLHKYGEHDVNVADIWVMVQFGEPYPGMVEAQDIRDAVDMVIIGLFRAHRLMVPDNYIIDLFWGPSHGKGCVNGTYIAW